METRERRRLLVDAAVAAGVLLLGFGEFTGVVAGSEFPGNRSVHAVFIVLVAVPLAVRRVWPLVSMLVVVVAVAVWQFALYGPDRQPPFEPFVALLLATFTAGLATSGRKTAIAVTVVGTGLCLSVLAVAYGEPIGSTIPAVLEILGVFALGRLLARYRARAVAEGERAARLEQAGALAREAAIREERSRIARELHDVISHDVNLMVLQASVERRMREQADAGGDDALASIEATGREALAELRRMLGVLRHDGGAAPLAPQPGMEQVPELLAQAREAGLDVELVVDPGVTLSPGLGLTAYRIVQESLTNVMKHSGGARAVAAIRHHPDCLEIEVVDDGAGCANPGGGLGLVGMRERVSVYGGTLVAGPRPDAPGFRVLARIPWSPA
ncbi:MAG TPA: histidine kinase [Propionibacteriaceae bacterium]|nr:histidine kinase [Propionibacteriaceae bacterium]